MSTGAASGGAAPNSILTQILTTDLVGLTRGRSVAADDIGVWQVQGTGWVPANFALDPFGAIADAERVGSSGDLRLKPDMSTETKIEEVARPAVAALRARRRAGTGRHAVALLPARLPAPRHRRSRRQPA